MTGQKPCDDALTQHGGLWQPRVTRQTQIESGEACTNRDERQTQIESGQACTNHDERQTQIESGVACTNRSKTRGDLRNPGVPGWRTEGERVLGDCML